MRFCIVGAGAIGGFVGAKLALGGEEVTFIARGRNLEAINADGMHIFYRDGREEIATTRARPRTTTRRPGPSTWSSSRSRRTRWRAVAGKLAPLYHDGHRR